jgi:cell fate (sporulation/competence/biofilm development) regulator YmcA (YheA/YmcA/DUF963 family)
MQHNWWLATFEHAGIITREEAMKLSEEIRLRIHKEDYVGAFREVETLLSKNNLLEKFNRLKNVQNDLAVLQKKVDLLTTPTSQSVLPKSLTNK